MSYTVLPTPEVSPAPEQGPPRRRRGAALAWVVIAAAVAVVLWRNAGRETAQAPARLVTLRLQARYIVGLVSFGFPAQVAYQQFSESLENAGYGQRLALVVLAGELVGPDEALDQLHRLESDRRAGEVEAPPLGVETAGLLRRLYAGYRKDVAAPPALSAAEEAALLQRMGWFASLALAPEDGARPEGRVRVLGQAQRTAITLLGATVLGIGGALVGGGLLLVLAVLAISRQLSGRLSVTGNGGVYAETFALYMALYLVLSLVLGLVARFLPIPQRWGLLLSAAGMLLSLVVLVWPRLRGVPWRQLREDLGWRLDRQAWATVPLGLGTYLAALPLLLMGLVLTLVLMAVARRMGLDRDPLGGGGPSHPIVGLAESGNLWVWLQMALVAVVIAPLVEEIMFRGLLYRHLREASARLGRAWSILAAGLLSSFVFAIIHPQGPLGVPPLMALAFTFALVREWRGTLGPPMIAHGINNGVMLLLLFVATS